MAISSNVIEADDRNFADAVLDESRRRPVVVDFWAAWCQPCRMIGPVLERLAQEKQGAFLLAKVDVDANPQLSQAFRIQSIPAVKAFRDGKVANEFIGAVPEQAIRQFLDSVLPSKADGWVEEARAAEEEGRAEEAGRLYRAALDADPGNVEAALGMGRLAMVRGELDEARRLLEPMRPEPEAERLLAAIDVSAWASPNGEGPLAAAERAAAEGRFGEALEVFLAAVQNGRPEDRDRARAAMLKVFAVLGDQDPMTSEYRRRLSAALF
ncbi:MAG TPA: thioredoxin [Actinomycetota bacterium]